MRRVVIVAYPGATTLDITGPAEAFGAALNREGAPAYRVVLASIGGVVCRTTSGVELITRDLRRVRPAPSDVVLVAGGQEAAVRAAGDDAALLSWLSRAVHVVELMTSVCSGAFLLAEAGLLDGRRATTHWSACDQLAHLYPRVRVEPNAIFVADGKLWTSAGVATGIDMSLAIVELHHGWAAADAVAATLVLYMRRPGFQSQFSEALISQLDGSEPLRRVTVWIRAHLRQADVENVARAAGLSVRTLHRRCRERLGITPGKLIDKLRVDHARSLLATSDVPAKRLAMECGFGTSTNMKRVFERELGVGPREYRLLHARPQRPPRAVPRRRG
ncbi:MAG TPA: helix-turn-helix domain-containing protein [Polyangiales bacterium]